MQMPLMMNWTSAALKNADFILADLQVFPDAMARNLALSKGLIVSEAVMMGLGEARRVGAVWLGILLTLPFHDQETHSAVSMHMTPSTTAVARPTSRTETCWPCC